MGTYYCTQCGAGDGIMLLEKFTKLPFGEIATRIEKMIGNIKPDPPKAAVDEQALRDAKNKLWSSGVALSTSNAAGKYLFSRGLDVYRSDRAIRFVEAIRHSHGSEKYPAMIAKIQDVKGNPVNIHITYLSQDGKKANVSPSRRIMAGHFPKGSAIRLSPENEVMGIAEGIETAMSAGAMFRVNTWSAVNANGLSSWEPPSICKKVLIFGDNDESFTGQKHAYDLANRLKCVNGLEVEVYIPQEVGYDWNDVARGMKYAE